MPQVEIREFAEHQTAELLAFFRKWAKDHPELGEGDILKWQRCDRFVALHEGRIVGYIAQIPHDFKYGEPSGRSGLEHIGWGVTLVLDHSDDGIRKQAGRGLLTRCENNPPLLFSGVGIVPTIEEPYKRRGYEIRRDCANMYARFIKPVNALRYLSKSLSYSPLIRVCNLLFSPKKTPNMEGIKKVYKFQKEWDDTWDRILQSQYEFYGVRDADYLNYKLSQPNREYHVFIHEGKGYIIFRIAKHRIRDLNLVKICDIVGYEDIKRNLLKIAVRFLYGIGAHGIVALAAASDLEIYKEMGLYIYKPYPIAMQKQFREKMHITFFESDLDNLW